MAEETASVQSLRLGRHRIWPPVMLAPMVGFTNAAFRQLCLEMGAGVGITEMINPRDAVAERSSVADKATFAPNEAVRVLQVCADEPGVFRTALQRLLADHPLHHLEVNLSCPHPSVTEIGAGAALLCKPVDVGILLSAAVAEAERYGLSVGLKMRTGIDEAHPRYVDVAAVAQAEGCVSVTVHGRSASKQFSGQADWSAARRLKDELTIPVIANGDVWEASDAVRIMAATGCDGVAVARGSLGRPWLFTQIRNVLSGLPAGDDPALPAVVRTVVRHAELLVTYLGEEAGMVALTPHLRWYLLGFDVAEPIAASLATPVHLRRLVELLDELDPGQTYPAQVKGVPRGPTGSPWPVRLPVGWATE